MSEEELEEICNSIVSQNLEIIKNQGPRSMGPLMGIVMKTVRGKAPGEMVSKVLEKKIREYSNKN